MLPERWEPHDDSLIMFKLPTATAVDQVLDAEIPRFSSWLEAFAARALHMTTLSHTALEASYNFMQ